MDGGNPERAVDGSRRTDYESKSCMHTGEDNHPFWQVSWDRNEQIAKVVITNRLEASSRLFKLEVKTMPKMKR